MVDWYWLIIALFAGGFIGAAAVSCAVAGANADKHHKGE